MRRGFYYSLACDGMKKNKKMYLPYILTCTGMVMMLYVILYLATSGMLENVRGGIATTITLNLGSIVIAFFSVIFLFYTNSFLMRRRRKEFGLYNMLGMSKGNICRILIWETFITFIVSVTIGLACGIAFSKLAELMLLKVLAVDTTYVVTVSAVALIYTVLAFAGIFMLLLLNAVRQVKFSTAMALLQSENYGEKPPKANWILGVGGFVLLAAAYYLAVSITTPLDAMIWFFVAVLMVIVATYMIFISGMVLICKILQSSKKYYYKANHFVSTSTMAYRMKRNGAGLASICILATMVLVMLSSTTSLYFGTEDSLHERYPRDINDRFWVENTDELSDAAFERYTGIIRGLAEEKGVKPQNIQNFRCVSTYVLAEGKENNFLKPASVDADWDMDAKYTRVMIVPLKDYNKMMGESIRLAADEVLVYPHRADFDSDTVSIDGLKTFRVKEVVDFDATDSLVADEMLQAITVITADFDRIAGELADLLPEDRNGESPMSKMMVYNFDTNGMTLEEQEAFRDEFIGGMSAAFLDHGISQISHFTESYAGNRADFYATYGALFFLAIVLSIVFIFAAVLIIYYKQISEGYEDQNKFAIMQKVGMTKGEIRKSINSQVLTVFFLPLLLAGLHMAFAFPMVQRVLSLFSLTNAQFFMLTTGISFAAFAVLYVIVYRITSKAYYNIVS